MHARATRKPALAAAAMLTLSAGTAHAACTDSTSADEAAIRGVLASYNDALNASSTKAVMPLYADDGVFMPPYSQSAVGTDAVRQAYDRVFKTITLHVTFTVAELVVMSPAWAFVRTNSAGTNKINATGATSAEGNQELFVFHKGDDCAWKIARYSFSPTSPPKR
jgi:uncharacterized protein (TIGR02246 family)